MSSHDLATSPPQPNPLTRLFPPDTPKFTHWLRTSYLDILTQLLLAGTAFTIYLTASPLLPRYFPVYPGVYTSAWGLRYGQPVREEYVSTVVSAVVSFCVPFVVMVVGERRGFGGGNAACMGLGYALSTSTLFQSLTKWVIGGLRPHFLSLCKPSLAPSFGGIGPGKIWHTSEVCTGDVRKLRDAQMSFPSGHSSAAFAGFGFLALYFNARVGILGRKDENKNGKGEEGKEGKEGGRIAHWKMALGVAPLVVAVLLAGSKVRDGWHHPCDVVAGAVIGMAFAVAAYRMVFRSVWDQRTNHLARERFGEKGEKRDREAADESDVV